jgi:hypothetical protein
MTVIASWGTKAFEISRTAVPREADLPHGTTFEVVNEVMFSRPVTKAEAQAAIADFVYRFKAEHPELDVSYVAVEASSQSGRIVVQGTVHSPIDVGTIIAIVVAVLLVAFIAIVLTVTGTIVYSIITLPKWVKEALGLGLVIVAIAAGGYIVYKIVRRS